MSFTLGRLSILAIASALLAVPSAASARSAMLECKSQPSPGMGLGQAAAKAAWVTYVTDHFGASWASLSLAKNQNWPFTGDLVNATIFSAVPCRLGLATFSPTANQRRK